MAWSKTAVTELMQIAWRSVWAIITRVCADIDPRMDRLGWLRRMGIDEISYKRGRRHLVVAVDHDTGRLVWAAPGADVTIHCHTLDLAQAPAVLLGHVGTLAGRIARAPYGPVGGRRTEEPVL